jgi:hypothetical protein
MTEQVIDVKEDELIVEGTENQPAPKQKAVDPLEVVPVPAEVAVGEPSNLEGKLPVGNVNPEAAEPVDTSFDLGHEPKAKEGKLPVGESVDIDDTAEKAIVEESLNVEVKLAEDINTLLESIDLTPEFKTQALGLFEAAIAARVADIKTALIESNEAAMATYKETLAAKIEEQTDAYVTEAVATWVEKNETNVKTSVRVQIAESFMANLKNLFESHYITVPEGKEDILEAALEKADEFEAKNVALEEEIKALKESANKAEKLLVIESLLKPLTDTQAERVRQLAEEVIFESKDEYEVKMQAIVESISKTAKPSEFIIEDANGEVVVEEVVTEEAKPEIKSKAVVDVTQLLSDMRNIIR